MKAADVLTAGGPAVRAAARTAAQAGACILLVPDPAGAQQRLAGQRIHPLGMTAFAHPSVDSTADFHQRQRGLTVHDPHHVPPPFPRRRSTGVRSRAPAEGGRTLPVKSP